MNRPPRHRTSMGGFSTWQTVILIFLAAVIGWFVAGGFRKRRSSAVDVARGSVEPRP